MSLPEITSREEWLVAREALLEREKEHTRQKEALKTDRRRMPMVAIEKDHEFEGPEGTLRLVDPFANRRQPVVPHFMFDPSWGGRRPRTTVRDPGLQLLPARRGYRLLHHPHLRPGTESCSHSHGLLDQTALGRQEDGEEPKGHATTPTAPTRISPRSRSAPAAPPPVLCQRVSLTMGDHVGTGFCAAH